MSPFVVEYRVDLEPCSQEEADSQMLLHVKNATELLRTVDTDVVVIAIGNFFSFFAEKGKKTFGKHGRYFHN